MTKKVNKTVRIYSDDKSDYFYSYKITKVTGTILAILFGCMTLTLPFFFILFIISIIITVKSLKSSYKSAEQKYEETMDIKNKGIKYEGELFHVTRNHVSSNIVDDYGGYYYASGLVKYIDKDGKIKYKHVLSLPKDFDAIKIIKADKKQLLNYNDAEKIEFDMKNINGSKTLVMLNEKTDTSHTIPVPHNFSGKIMCYIYEKDGKQLVDDFEFIDVEVK